MKKDKFGILLLILLSSIFIVLFGILLIVKLYQISDPIVFIFQIITSVLLGIALIFLILAACLLSRVMVVLKNSFAMFAGMIGLVSGILTIALGISTKDGVSIIAYGALLAISSIISICIEPFMILALVNKDKK